MYKMTCDSKINLCSYTGICEGWPFINSLKCTRTLQIVIDPNPGCNSDLFIELFNLHADTSANKIKLTSVFFNFCDLIIIIYFTTCFSS